MISFLVLALIIIMLGPPLALAAPVGSIVVPASISTGNTSACYSISDADIRSFCLARARHEPAQCYNIMRQDLRQQCLAEVSR